MGFIFRITKHISILKQLKNEKINQIILITKEKSEMVLISQKIKAECSNLDSAYSDMRENISETLDMYISEYDDEFKRKLNMTSVLQFISLVD